ncbi:maintenance of mitochondrial morphology protein 1 [Mycena alexandri]|uniref:Maintenance of mitochondrial morphology protein 1 n=1 Tax=Mycena alexandri TaxID=1745969 RepID=A0AAD6TBZ1_9AGAR|nr:maintenance of mitochondrial morphology protein 1 [Mycena alexandri]
MGTNYVFSLQPTFTQGLILGQLSILVLLVLILKYLFLDSTETPFETSSYHPRVDSDLLLRKQRISSHSSAESLDENAESAEWFNMLLHQVVEIYRSKLRDGLAGADGDEVARKRIEDYANKIRPPGFLDHINILSVDLGVSAPRLSNARIKRQDCSEPLSPLSEAELDLSYTDTISLALSTSYLFNYPMPSFARLPVSLTISLSLFKSSIIITPPAPTASTPVVTLAILPDFTLDLTTTSLMGSRAKLANVPKLHELIQHQVRRILAAREPWRVVLPGLTSVAEVRQVLKELKEEPVM